MSDTTDAACQHHWAPVHGVWGGIIGYVCFWCRKWWDCTPLRPPGVEGGRS